MKQYADINCPECGKGDLGKNGHNKVAYIDFAAKTETKLLYLPFVYIYKDNYLLELVRYIHCNPVRAKLAKSLLIISGAVTRSSWDEKIAL